MAEREEIKRIELRRLAELEKVRAAEGPRTDPAILIEIADLREKYGPAATAVSRAAAADDSPRSIGDLWNDVDFLRAMLSSALRRLQSLEEAAAADAIRRQASQWYVRAGIAATVVLQAYQIWRR